MALLRDQNQARLQRSIELLTQVAGLKPGVPAEVNIWRRQGEVNLRLTPAERPTAKQRK